MKKDNKILISIVIVLLVIIVGVVVGVCLWPKKEYKNNNQNNDSQSSIEEKQVEQNNSQTVEEEKKDEQDDSQTVVEEDSLYVNESFVYIDVLNTDFLVSEPFEKEFVSNLGITKGKTIIQKVTIQTGNETGPEPFVYLTNEGEVYYLPEDCDSILIYNDSDLAACSAGIEKEEFGEKISQIYLFKKYSYVGYSPYQYSIIFKSESNKYYYLGGGSFDLNKASIVEEYENLSVYNDGTVIYKNIKQNFNASQIILPMYGNIPFYLKDSKTNNWYVIDDNGIGLYDKNLSLKDGNIYFNDVKIGDYLKFWG